MSVLTIFIQKAIVQGICILYGALGEIMTEKSGNLNLGIPGIMYMGGIAGLMGAFLYEKDNPNPNAFIGVLISFVCEDINGNYGIGCELQRKRVECAIMIKAALAE